MSEYIYFPIEMHKFAKNFSKIMFTLENVTIEIKSSYCDTDDEYFGFMPNLHKYVTIEKKIKKYIYNEIIVRQPHNKTLIIKNFNLKYFELFINDAQFKMTFLKLYRDLTFDIDDFLADCDENIKIIHFDKFVMCMNEEFMGCAIFEKHNLYFGMIKLSGSIDCINKVFGYIDFPNLCKMRSVSTNFAYIIEGCTMPPNALRIMRSLNLEFSYGCMYNISKSNILNKYDECIEKYNKYIQENGEDQKNLFLLNNYMIRIINEFIITKIMIIHRFGLANNLIDHLHGRFSTNYLKNIEDNEELNFVARRELIWKKFLSETFVDMNIISHFLENKKIYDLYSLINLTIIRGTSKYNKLIGSYILYFYGYQKFLDVYVRNGWKYFPDLNYKAYTYYADMINYIKNIIANNIRIPFTIKNYFLETITDDDIRGCSLRIAKRIVNEAIDNDNVEVFSKIFEHKKIKKSKKAYLKYAYNLNEDCDKILKYLKNTSENNSKTSSNTK